MTKIRPGWHFLQTPGPSNVPERILRAMSRPTIDHRSAEFAELTHEILAGLQWLFQTKSDVIVHPSSGSGGWESALVNTLSPGDRVLMFENGFFGQGWAETARRMCLEVDLIQGDWRRGPDPAVVEARLRDDRDRTCKAVAVLHNETSTGVVGRVAEIRRAIDRADHPALLLVDVISSLGSLDYRHDEWGVDATVAGSQKGIMLPPGLAFVAISAKAREASKRARLPRAYWDWERIIASNKDGFFHSTPATNLFFGLREALAMLREEGLAQVIARHARHGEATRAAVRAWGLEIQCAVPDERSNVLTAVRMPEGHHADQMRAFVLDRFNMSLGSGLGQLKGKVFRIGHLGHFNDLMLIATLAGVESGCALSGVPITRGGVDAAIRSLEGS